MIERQLQKLNPNDINIDHANYQRSLKATYKKIALHYDPLLVGVPAISKREDGSYWAVDGQHRVAAAKEKQLTTLECLVYTGLTLADEIKMFSQQNINRKAITSYEAYNAGKSLQGTQHAALYRCFRLANVVPTEDRTVAAPRCIGTYLLLLRLHGATHLINLIKVMKKSNKSNEPALYNKRYLHAISRALQTNTKGEVLKAINQYPIEDWYNIYFGQPNVRDANIIIKNLSIRG